MPYYKKTIIHKNGKVRVLEIPDRKTKGFQKMTLNLLRNKNDNWNNMPYCFSYLNKKWIKEMVLQHLNKRYIIKIDIKGFFNSINTELLEESVIKYCNEWNYSSKKIDKINNLIKRNCMHENKLPVWAPSSPFLSNIVWKYTLDIPISNFIKTNYPEINYTRYSDDLIFSLENKYINKKMFIKKITNILNLSWFTVNNEKTRILNRSNKQIVTWIVVNRDTPWVLKKERLKLKFYLNIINKHKIETAMDLWNKNNSSNLKPLTDKKKLIEILQWKLAYINMVNKIQWYYFIKKYPWLIINWKITI